MAKKTAVVENDSEADMNSPSMGFPDMSTDPPEEITDVEDGSDSAADAAPTLTKEEQLAKCIDDTENEITRFMPRMNARRELASSLKEQASDAKKGVDVDHKHLAMLCQRMANAKNGILPDKPYQLSLPENADDDGKVSLPAVDEGAAKPLGMLREYGLTEKMVDILIDHDMNTVGDLEKRMREDAWWMKKIKGFGEEKVTRLIDSLVDFRKAFPMPSANDGDEEEEQDETDAALDDNAQDGDHDDVEIK